MNWVTTESEIWNSFLIMKLSRELIVSFFDNNIDIIDNIEKEYLAASQR